MRAARRGAALRSTFNDDAAVVSVDIAEVCDRVTDARARHGERVRKPRLGVLEDRIGQLEVYAAYVDRFCGSRSASMKGVIVPQRYIICPWCHAEMHTRDQHGVEIDLCPNCQGVWLDRGELEQIVERSRGATVPDDRDAITERDAPDRVEVRTNLFDWF